MLLDGPRSSPSSGALVCDVKLPQLAPFALRRISTGSPVRCVRNGAPSVTTWRLKAGPQVSLEIWKPNSLFPVLAIFCQSPSRRGL